VAARCRRSPRRRVESNQSFKAPAEQLAPVILAHSLLIVTRG
jgi:hypothetical protein